MWIRKTDEEIKNSKKKQEDEFVGGVRLTPLKLSICIFVFVFVFEVVVDTLIGKSKGRFYLPIDYVREKVTLSELPGMIPQYLALASILGVVAYFSMKQLRGAKLGVSTFICEKCFRVKADDKDYKCECGGEYIEIDKMKWIEENE